MKRFNPTKVAIALALLTTTALVSGCGSNNSSVLPLTTQMNGVYGAGMPSGCLSMTQPLGFTDPSGYIDSINVAFGSIPTTDPYAPGQTFGQIALTIGGAGGPYMAPNSQATIAPDGSISMNINPLTGGQLPGVGMAYNPAVGMLPSTAVMTGTVIISPAKQAMVLSEITATYPSAVNPLMTTSSLGIPQGGLMTYTAANICIVGLAGELSHNNYNLYGGYVYAYFLPPNNINGGMSLSGLTGASLYSLPKIVLKF